MVARLTVLRAVRELEMDTDIDDTTEVTNIERDSPEQITIYGTEKDGKMWYLVLNQALLNWIKAVDETSVVDTALEEGTRMERAFGDRSDG